MGSQDFSLIWSYTGSWLIWLLQFRYGYVFIFFSQPTLRIKSPEPLLLINYPFLKAGEFARDHTKNILQWGATSTGVSVLQSFEDRDVEQPWTPGAFLFMLSLRQWRILRTKLNLSGLHSMIYLFWSKGVWVFCMACECCVHVLCVFMHGGWKSILGVLKFQLHTVGNLYASSGHQTEKLCKNNWYFEPPSHTSSSKLAYIGK